MHQTRARRLSNPFITSKSLAHETVSAQTQKHKMKRSQDSVSSPRKSSSHKKAKVAPNQVVHHASTAREDDHDAGEAEWTRVEKRKTKKNKKVEAKHDVCLISAFLCRPQLFLNEIYVSFWF